VDCPLSKRKVSTLENKKPPLPPHSQEKREALSLHDTTSHWLHRNSIHTIGCHYFWPGVITLPKNTLPIQSFWKNSWLAQFLSHLLVVWLIFNINIYAPSNITNVPMFQIWV
jgi:hypothetical protein